MDKLHRRHFFAIGVITRDTATRKNCLKVVLAAKLFPGVIEASANPHATVRFFNNDIKAVQRITIRIAADNVVSANNILVGVGVGEAFVVYLYGQGDTDQSIAINDANLSLWKLFDQALNRVLWPGAAQLRISFIHEYFNIGILLQCQVAQLKMKTF